MNTGTQIVVNKIKTTQIDPEPGERRKEELKDNFTFPDGNGGLIKYF